MPRYDTLPVPDGYFLAQLPGDLWLAGRLEWDADRTTVVQMTPLMREGKTLTYQRRYSAIVACLKDKEQNDAK